MTIFWSCLAYLSGSIPFGLLLTRLFAGRDVRDVGSGNIGAANVARAAGTPIGIAVAVLDALKGAIPVLVAGWTGASHAGLALVALAAVLGHDFSIFLSFKGGKGVATTLGVSLVLVPGATLFAAVTWLLILFTLRYTSLASLGALAVLPLSVMAGGQPRSYVVMSAALFALAALKHWENIIRLVKGREPRFREGRADSG